MWKLYSMGQKWLKVCNNERVLSKTFLQTEQIEKVKAAWKALQQKCSNFLMQLFLLFQKDARVKPSVKRQKKEVVHRLRTQFEVGR